jgi:hypothetical protein
MGTIRLYALFSLSLSKAFLDIDFVLIISSTYSHSYFILHLFDLGYVWPLHPIRQARSAETTLQIYH